MTDLSPDQKIEHAALLIYNEINERGGSTSHATCQRVARTLYDLWMRPGGPQRHIRQGEVAQKFRERYEEFRHQLIDGSLVIKDDVI